MRCLLLKKPLLIIGLLLSVAMGYGQKHDNNWLWGADIYNQVNPFWGNGQGDFNSDSIKTYPVSPKMPFWETGLAYSNEEGELLLYTNGMRVSDTTGNLIEYGDSINHGLWWDQAYQALIQGYWGYYIRRGVIMLPGVNDDSAIIMIHEYGGESGISTDSRVKLTTIQRKNSGSYQVTSKNKTLSQYAPAFQNLAACKHGNGRDWWILFTENNTNCVVKLLVSLDSIYDYGRQCIGDTIADGWGVKANFSLDGNKYSSTDATKFGTNIFDFDRCSGILSNPKHIPAIFGYDSMGNANDFVNSIDFSPDGKLFYVLLGQKILQFDLDSPTFPNDFDTIVGWDTFIDTVPGHNAVPFVYFSSTYGPNGILYISNSGGQRFLCTINNPNGKGVLCDFKMRNIVLPKFWLYTSPNYPNYRLGRSIGSACDTVYSDIKPIYKETPWLKVYPNPATDNVRLDYNWVEWERILDCRLQILDLKGRVMYEQEVPRYSTRQDVSVKQLPQGVYTVTMQDGAKKIAVCKLTVVR